MSDAVTPITDTDFAAEVLAADKPVLVYFWATWCGPCRLMSPIMSDLAVANGDRLKIVKMEVNPDSTAVADYNVEGVPALRLFVGGKLVETREGVMSKPQVEQLLTNHLSSMA
ncbi:MAG: thioredoxin domain-containing protein [Cyanobacteria bacterium P01_A01_bin.123]